MKAAARRKAIAVVLAAGMGGLGVAAGPVAGGAVPAGAAVSLGRPAHLSAGCTGRALQAKLYKPAQLTIATDSPAYTPWFVNNKPSNGQGYEGGVADAVARQLGFAGAQVRWVVEPFDSSYAPGPKAFDFDINEISYTAERAQAVSFSSSYYNVTQALVALKGDPIVAKHSRSELRGYSYGDQIGTTSLAFIESQIRPTRQPQVFNTLNDVKSALADHRIDAFVTDTPTAQYISSSEIPHSVLVGKFPSTGEHYGLLFKKGDPLVGCVDQALSALRSNGTLANLQHRWLQIYQQVPTLEP